MRRRIVIALGAILLVPIPALAFDDQGTQQIAVSASVAGCGLVEHDITCQIDVSYSAVENADSYTVSVAGPNGAAGGTSATTAGTVSVFVPYGGSGSYSIEVAAYGTAPPPQKGEALSRASIAVKGSGGEAGGSHGTATSDPLHTPSPGPAPQEPTPAEAPQPGADPAEPEPAEPECPEEASAEAEPEAAAAATASAEEEPLEAGCEPQAP